MIGSTVGHYRILERLGGGSMGVVYRAEDTRLQREVALKFLPIELSDDTNAKERFLREARAASRLDHPSICTVHEIAETDDGQLYIVMACYSGQTLKKRIGRGPLPVTEAIDYAWHVARGLAKAHAENVIHRDVKPANVLITDDGEVKILDFGLAKMAGDVALTRTGSSIGTPVYMSPEQIGGTTDARSDIWSLGVVLYEMLAGERPFRGSSSATAMYAIMHRSPTPLSEVRPGLPETLQPIIDRALARDLDKRYQSMSQLADDLADAGSLEMTVTQPMRVEAPSQASRSWRRPAALLFAVGLAIVAVWAISSWSERTPDTAAPSTVSPVTSRSVAVLPFTFRGSNELAYLREGMVDLLSTKLDGAGDLRSVDPRSLLGDLAEQEAGQVGRLDLDHAAELARRFDADLFLLGNIVEVAGQLRLDARLYQADSQPTEVATASAEGSADEIFNLIDRLAAQLLAAGQDGGPHERIAGLAAVTTESFPALKAYLEGESAYRDGRFEDAADGFEAAVTEDPEFALAWYRLALVAEWLVDAERAVSAAHQAQLHAGRLAEHDQLLVEALAAYTRGDAVEAERLYRDIVHRHPDDVEAWAGLGETQFHYGPLDGRSRRHSRASWQRVELLEPDDFNAQLHLARLDLYEGDPARLQARTDHLERLFRGTDKVAEVEFFRASMPGGSETRVAIQQEVRSSSLSLAWMPPSFFAASSWRDPTIWLPTISLLLEGDRTPRERTYAHRLLGVLRLALGRIEEADRDLMLASAPNEMVEEYRALSATVSFLPLPRRRIEELRATVADWPVVASDGSAFSPIVPHGAMPAHLRAYVLGLLSARLGELDATLELAAELEGLGPPPLAAGLHFDLAAGLRAEVARQQGDSAAVLETLGERRAQYSYQLSVFSPLFSQVRERWLRAEALYELERWQEAYDQYEALAEINLFDLVYLAYSHLRRAQICERQGRGEDAAAHYRRVLELWSEGDATLGRLLAAARTGAVRNAS